MTVYRYLVERLQHSRVQTQGRQTWWRLPQKLTESTRTSSRSKSRRWSIGWQSAGATPEPWRGPDILEIIDDRAATGEVEAVLVCAQGFVADHLEVAYDLDIETRARAAEAGIGFARTEVLNDDAVVLGALARRVAAASTDA